MRKKGKDKRERFKKRRMARKIAHPESSTEDQYNWNSIEYFLSRKRWIRKPEDRKALKDYYLYKKKPDIRLSPIVRSIADISNFRDVVSEVKDDELKCSDFVESIFELQANTQFSFGDNSLLIRKEKDILDELEYPNQKHIDNFRDRFVRAQINRQGRDKELSSYLVWRFRTTFCQNYAVADHIQLHRSLEMYEAKILSISNQTKVDEQDGLQELLFLGSEVARIHPDRFNGNILKTANRVNMIMSSENNPEIIQEYYYRNVQSKVNSFIENRLVGGQVVACIKYDTSFQRDSMVETIRPESRHPMCDLPGKNVMRHLKKGEGWTSVSRAIVNGLWECEFQADELHLVDEKTLVIKNSKNKNLSGGLAGYDLLAHDASFIKEMYNVDNAIPEKEDISEAHYFPGVAVVENIVGRIFVKLLGPTLARALPVEEHQELLKIYEKHQNIESFCVDLVSGYNYRVLEKLAKNNYFKI